MAAVELLTELEDAKYVGKTVTEKLVILNEWHSDNLLCLPKPCRAKLDSLLLAERVAIAHSDGKIDDRLYARWLGWYNLTEGVAAIDFTAEPIRVNDLIATLEAAGVITAPEPTWLLDLGRRLWTIGRKVWGGDPSDQDIEASEALRPRFAEVEAQLSEIARLTEELRVTRDALQQPNADPNTTVPWKVADAERVR